MFAAARLRLSSAGAAGAAEVLLGNAPASGFNFGGEAFQAYQFTVGAATTITKIVLHTRSNGSFSSAGNITMGITDTAIGGATTPAGIHWLGNATVTQSTSAAQDLTFVLSSPAACSTSTTYYIVVEAATDALGNSVGASSGTATLGTVSLNGNVRYGTLANNGWPNTLTNTLPGLSLWGHNP